MGLVPEWSGRRPRSDRIGIMLSIALLGWLGAALSIVLPWPQVWRSVARRRTRGLSATACWQGAAVPVGWITYGLLTGEAVQIVTNVATGVAGLAVLVAVLVRQPELRTGRGLLISAAGAAGVLLATAGCAAAGLWTGLGGARAAVLLSAVLAAIAVLGAIPQPLSLLRDRRQDLTGLSPLRWWLTAIASGSWFGYGLATSQAAVWLSGLVGLGSSLIVCWVLVAAGRARTAGPAGDSIREAHPALAATTAPAATPAAGSIRAAHPAPAMRRELAAA